MSKLLIAFCLLVSACSTPPMTTPSPEPLTLSLFQLKTLLQPTPTVSALEGFKVRFMCNRSLAVRRPEGIYDLLVSHN